MNYEQFSRGINGVVVPAQRHLSWIHVQVLPLQLPFDPC